MRRPSTAILAAAGRARALILVAVTAPVLALLLIAASILRVDPAVFRREDDPFGPAPASSSGTEVLLDPLTDPGTRGGVIFAIALMAVPLLVLLRQAVRLGASDRDRRYAALRVAGATRRDLVRWGALEVVVPTAVGVVGGFALWLLARELLGWPRFDPGGAGGLVPTQTGPGVWALVAIAVLLVDAVVVGARAGGRSADAWQTAKALPKPPGLWRPAVLLLALAAVPTAVIFGIGFGLADDTQVVAIPLLAFLVLALVVAAPWLGWLLARLTAARTNRVATLLAARRLAADPRPAARAAATVGAAALACSMTARYGIGGWSGGGIQAATIGVSVAVCFAGAVLAIGVVAIAIAVRSAEAVAERRREVSALVATGVPSEVVNRSLAAEARLVALPITVLGAGLGTAFGLLTSWSSAQALLVLVAGVGTIGLCLVALHLATLLTRGVVRDAVAPANLRTE